MADAAVHPVYVLNGGDAFLRDARRSEVIAAVIGDADPQVAVTSFDADAEPAEVFDELRTIPFLSPRRVVVVRDADGFVRRNRAAVEKYLEAPSDCSVLVLEVNSWASNTRLYKTVKRIGRAIDCSPPNAGGVGRRLRDMARARGKTLAGDAAELLAQWIGQDLAALDGEIEKLSLYVGERQTITAADVGELVTATAGPGAFALTNAVTAGDVRGALTALDGMCQVRGEEFRTLGLLTWHLRRALKAKRQLDAGRTPDLKMPAGPKRDFLAMLRRRSQQRLAGDFRALLRADLALKSGRRPQAAMQQLVVDLCTG
ncbi:MAG: DNA polymerase III subunit delta [Phycisphaerae bacterium]|nr:DNA polymerase III subunit delta [Phycisphaerae bacterium]